MDQNLVGSSPGTLTGGPDVSCLTLAFNIYSHWEQDDTQSPQPSDPGKTTTEKKKQSRCTKNKILLVYFATEAQAKKLKDLAKAKSKQGKK
jgi:hypothetical protein